MVNIMSTKQKTLSAKAQYTIAVEANATELSFKDWKLEQYQLAELVPMEVVSEVVVAAIEVSTAALEVVEVAKVVTKKSLALAIFNEELATGQLVRKNVLARLITESGFTKAGANTYYQNMRKEAGLVSTKAV